PQPGTDLEDALPRSHVRRAHDLADRAAVVDEVLAERLGRADAEAPRQVADLGRTQQGTSGVAHGTQAYRPGSGPTRRGPTAPGDDEGRGAVRPALRGAAVERPGTS